MLSLRRVALPRAGHAPAALTVRALLHRIARRCPTHDRASQYRIRELERALGLPPSPPSGDLVDQLANPALIDCGHAWCRTQRK